jgi:hypothetical protein
VKEKRMAVALVASTFAIGLMVLGCTNSDPASSGPSTPGSGGSGRGAGAQGSGGAAGSSTGTGGRATGGSAGETGGGQDASTGSDDASSAEDASVDGATSEDGATADTGEGDGNPGGYSLPGKPWIHLCPLDDTHEECCTFLCDCLKTVCADSPLDQSGIENCETNCPKLSDMTLRCHIYHCYESLNPNVTKDHVSHCGHASGRVGGGGCPTAVYQ